MPEKQRVRGTGRNKELTNAQRKQLCLHKESTAITNRELSQWATEKFSVRVSEMTISRTLKRRDKWVSDTTTPDGKRARKLVCPEVEDATYAWFCAMQDKGGPVTDALICEAARRFYSSLNHHDTKKQLVFSHGWLGRFKKRHGIKGHMHHNERALLPDSTAEESLHEIAAVKSTISDYENENVFHMEDSGLLFALEPFKTLAIKRVSVARLPYETVTVGFTANLDGSMKLPPLVINKYTRPQAFISRNIQNPVNLGILWHASHFAKMTRQIFESYVLDFEKRMLLAGKAKVLLLVNSEYTELLVNVEKSLKITEVKFLPSSSGGRGGIVGFVKACYRKHLLQYQIDCVLSRKEPNVDIYHAVVCLEKSWRGDVTPAVISNGWKHMQASRERQLFGDLDALSEARDPLPRQSFELKEQLCEISELLEQLGGYSTGRGMLPDMRAQEYVLFEEENGLAASYASTEDEICADTFQAIEFEEEAVDPQVPAGGVPPVNYSSVQESLQSIRTYLLQQREDATEMVQTLRALEANLASHHARVGRQRDIARLFITDS